MNDRTYAATQVKAMARAAQTQMELFAPTKMSAWKNKERAIANELARCALFSCRNPKLPRLVYTEERLFSLDQTVVTYTGIELRSNDKEVWLALAHAARGIEVPEGAKWIDLELSSSDICRLIGWQPKKHYYVEIYKSISRMKATNLNVSSPRLRKARAYQQARRSGANEEELARLYHALLEADKAKPNPKEPAPPGIMMSMISDGVEYDPEGAKVVDQIPVSNVKWKIPLNIEILSLFAWTYLTLLPFEQRKKLPHGVARNLQEYFMSNKEPHGVKVSSLARMLNLHREDPYENKRVIIAALQKLVDAEVLESFYLEEGRGDVLVHVVRAARKEEEEEAETSETDTV